jgi:hypothetical protein
VGFVRGVAAVYTGGLLVVFGVGCTSPVFAVGFWGGMGFGRVAGSTCFLYSVEGTFSFIVAITSAYVILAGFYICTANFSPCLVVSATDFAMRVRGPGAWAFVKNDATGLNRPFSIATYRASMSFADSSTSLF